MHQDEMFPEPPKPPFVYVEKACRTTTHKYRDGWGAWCFKCRVWLLWAGPEGDAVAAAVDHLAIADTETPAA